MILITSSVLLGWGIVAEQWRNTCFVSDICVYSGTNSTVEMKLPNPNLVWEIFARVFTWSLHRPNQFLVYSLSAQFFTIHQIFSGGWVRCTTANSSLFAFISWKNVHRKLWGDFLSSLSSAWFSFEMPIQSKTVKTALDNTLVTVFVESFTFTQIRIVCSGVDREWPFPQTCTAVLVLAVQLIGFQDEVFGSVGESVKMVLLWIENNDNETLWQKNNQQSTLIVPLGDSDQVNIWVAISSYSVFLWQSSQF